MYVPAQPALITAYDTMHRGAGFLAARASAGLSRDAAADPVRAKVIGNGLRELDRFLAILVAARGRSAGIDAAAGGRRTAQRLGRLRAGLGLADPDQPRLQALERSRSCLYYCAGEVRQGDRRDGGMFTSGWHVGTPGASPLRRLAVGARLIVADEDVAEVCGFYQALADTLMAKAGPSG